MSVPSRRVPVIALLAAAAFAAGGVLAAPPAPPKTSSKGMTTYRWVDDQGVVHYSDEIPAPAAGKDREVMNAQGVPVRHLEGQKSSDELATEARDRAAVIKQKQHDSFLVTTYTSVKDIEALRDARLEQLKAQRAAAQQYIESLRARIGALQSRALTYRPYNGSAGARRMPDDLAEDLVHTLSEMRTQSGALANQAEVESKLRSQFQEDIERYRELHTLHSSN